MGGISSPSTICDNGKVWVLCTDEGFNKQEDHLSVNKDGRRLFCCKDQIQVDSSLILTKKKIRTLSWTPNNLILVTADEGGLYDPESMTQLLPFHNSQGASYQAEEHLLALWRGVEVSLWDIRCSHNVWRLNRKYPNNAALSRSCRSLAIRLVDDIKIFDLRKPDHEETIVKTITPSLLAALSFAAAQKEQRQSFPDESGCPETLRKSYHDIVELIHSIDQKKDKEDEEAIKNQDGHSSDLVDVDNLLSALDDLCFGPK